MLESLNIPEGMQTKNQRLFRIARLFKLSPMYNLYDHSFHAQPCLKLPLSRVDFAEGDPSKVYRTLCDGGSYQRSYLGIL